MSAAATSKPIRLRARAFGVGALVTGAGLVAGFAGVRLLGATDRPGASGVPSVKEFSFPVTPLGDGARSTGPAEAPAQAVEAPTPVAAVGALFQAERDGAPESAWALLDAPARARFPTPAAWARARAGRPAPLSFEIVAVDPAPAGAVDVRVIVTSAPSLDPFGGLVTAESEVVWRARQEPEGWRVAAEPESTRFKLPPEEKVAPATRDWVAAVSACDGLRARTLQAVEVLYGPADLAQAPCRRPGAWVVGTPVALSASGDTSTLQAAFGADVVSWARAVLVRPDAGPGFFVALAPVGDGWRVMGVMAAGP